MNAMIESETTSSPRPSLSAAEKSRALQGTRLIVIKQARQPMADRYPEVQAVLRDAQELTQQQSRPRLEARPAGEQPLPYAYD